MGVFSTENALAISAISTSTISADELHEALNNEQDQAECAGLCIVAGLQKNSAVMERLWQLMDDDTLAARCAAWAMGQLDCQSFLQERMQDAGLDQREQGYHCLAYVVARQAQTDSLESFLIERIADELKRVSDGKTGLGEHACRVLAMLGSDQAEALAKQIISEDQYCDRFELQRLRKAIGNDGRDQESLNDYARPWMEIFEDDCADDSMAGGETAAAPEQTEDARPETAADAADQTGDDPNDGDPQGPQQIDIVPIDWETFLSSPEAAQLDDQARQIVSQMGPMFEQLSAQALQKNLAELNSQELMVMVLQILPQAIPPEYMQAALSPPALNGMQLLARWLNNSGTATEGDELEKGVRQIREQIVKQIRASGSLNSSEYDEPDYLKSDNDNNSDS